MRIQNATAERVLRCSKCKRQCYRELMQIDCLRFDHSIEFIITSSNLICALLLNLFRFCCSTSSPVWCSFNRHQWQLRWLHTFPKSNWVALARHHVTFLHSQSQTIYIFHISIRRTRTEQRWTVCVCVWIFECYTSLNTFNWKWISFVLYLSPSLFHWRITTITCNSWKFMPYSHRWVDFIFIEMLNSILHGVSHRAHRALQL